MSQGEKNYVTLISSILRVLPVSTVPDRLLVGQQLVFGEDGNKTRTTYRLTCQRQCQPWSYFVTVRQWGMITTFRKSLLPRHSGSCLWLERENAHRGTLKSDKGKNRHLYESSSEIPNINNRFSSGLHTPTANLTTFQKGPFYFGIKVFNHLPTSTKNTSHYKSIQICSQKFPSYKFILLVGGIFYLEFQ